jgi:hypothetical protein
VAHAAASAEARIATNAEKSDALQLAVPELDEHGGECNADRVE